LETQISVSLNLDGSGKSSFNTACPSSITMLDQIARHGLLDLAIVARAICILMRITPSKT